MEIISLVGALGSNTHILIKNDNVIIIDAGAKIDKVESVVGNKKVLGILLTHLHCDHVIGLNNIVDKYHAPVYLYDSKLVEDSDYTLKFLFGKLTMPKDCYIDCPEHITLGDFDIQCIHTPGHSADSMCYKVEDRLFSGDTLFRGSIGRTDLATSSVPDMLSSLEQLINMDFEMCYSGHGDSTTKYDQVDNIRYFLMEL